MKKKIRNWFLPVLLLAILPIQTNAQSAKLSIEDFSIQAGEEKELIIDLTNSEEITLVQFDLRLPSGLSLKVEGGDYVFDIAGRTTWKNHSLSANAQANGTIRFLLASSKNAALSGNSGAIITMPLVAGASFKSGTITLENILMVTPTEKEIKQGTYSYNIGNTDPDPGPNPDPDPTPDLGDTYISYEPFSIKAGQEKELIIDLTNPNEKITLVQFDLRLPSGLSLKKNGNEYDFDMAGRTDWRHHSLDLNMLDNGCIRFLLSSTSNTTISGTEGAIIKMTPVADGSYTGGIVSLENILMVTPDEKEIRQGTFPPEAETTLLVKERPFTIIPGEEKELVIDLQNPNDEITLVQFDLRLPKGLSLKKNENEYDFDMAGRTDWRYHSLDLSPLADGSIRVLLSSTNNTVIKDKQGALMKMTLVADDSFSVGDIILANILLVTPQEKEIKPSDVSLHITALASASANLTIEDFTFYANGEAKVVIGLDNPKDEITLVQFDMHLPEGLSMKRLGDDFEFEISGNRTTSRKHSIDANPTDDGVRFLLSSNSNATFIGTQGPIIEVTFMVENNFREGTELALEDILLVTPSEKEIKPEHVIFPIYRNDVNSDGAVDVADIATIISVMTGESGVAYLAADVNNDGKVDVADIASVIDFMAGE